MTDPRFDDFDAGIQAEEFYAVPNGWQAIEADDMDEEELALLDEIDAHADYEWEQAIDEGFLD